jgi:N-acetylmuramoyl-L-alanine amidase CwlA
MKIVQDFLTLGSTNRPGEKLNEIRGLIIHYVGVPEKSAIVIRNNFEDATRYGSTQYICDYNDGHIIQTMPEDELAYHCGANVYKQAKFEIAGEDNPNYYLVGMETCIASVQKSKPSNVQWNALTEFSADFLHRNGLGVKDLYLHNEITYTQCYKWFVDHPNDWLKFKNDVQSILNRIT